MHEKGTLQNKFQLKLSILQAAYVKQNWKVFKAVLRPTPKELTAGFGTGSPGTGHNPELGILNAILTDTSSYPVGEE
jgi:hypothetical protein